MRRANGLGLKEEQSAGRAAEGKRRGEIDFFAPPGYTFRKSNGLRPGRGGKGMEQGLVEIYYGDGKGKTTAAAGCAPARPGKGCGRAFFSF